MSEELTLRDAGYRGRIQSTHRYLVTDPGSYLIQVPEFVHYDPQRATVVHAPRLLPRRRAQPCGGRGRRRRTGTGAGSTGAGTAPRLCAAVASLAHLLLPAAGGPARRGRRSAGSWRAARARAAAAGGTGGCRGGQCGDRHHASSRATPAGRAARRVGPRRARLPEPGLRHRTYRLHCGAGPAPLSGRGALQPCAHRAGARRSGSGDCGSPHRHPDRNANLAAVLPPCWGPIAHGRPRSASTTGACSASWKPLPGSKPNTAHRRSYLRHCSSQCCWSRPTPRPGGLGGRHDPAAGRRS